MALTAWRRGVTTGCFLNERIGPQLLRVLSSQPLPLHPCFLVRRVLVFLLPIFTSPDVSKHLSSSLWTDASLFIGRILLEGTDGPGSEPELATLVLCDVNRFFLFPLFK